MAAPPHDGQEGHYAASASGSRRPSSDHSTHITLNFQPSLNIVTTSEPAAPPSLTAGGPSNGWDSVHDKLHPGPFQHPYNGYLDPPAVKHEELGVQLTPTSFWGQPMAMEASSSIHVPSYAQAPPPSADVSMSSSALAASPHAIDGLVSLPGKRRMLRDGPHAGSVVRLALELVLPPSVGRAFIDLRDRKPLLPAAVIKLRCYASTPKTGAPTGAGTLPHLDDDSQWDDNESSIDIINISQLICSVSLLQTATLPPSFANYSFRPGEMPPPPPPTTALVNANSVPQPTEPENTGRGNKRAKLSATPSPSGTRRHSDLSSTSSHSAQVARVKNLHGRVYVNARKITVPVESGGDGQLGVWFTFPDICVKYDGRYHLLFRLFDLSVSALSPPLPAPDTTSSFAPTMPTSPGSPGGCLCDLISDPIDIVDAKAPMPSMPIHPLVEFLTR